MPDAWVGLRMKTEIMALVVDFPALLLEKVAEADRPALLALLAEDPRPSYQDDPERVYGMPYAAYDVQFTVAEGRLTVCDVLARE